MRAISLVNKVEFQFVGNVARNALTLGDVDNDGFNELIVGNNKGEVAIFKGRDRIQTLKDLSFVTCVAVGDILNKGKNSLVIVTADGWCYIYDNLYKPNEELLKTPGDVDLSSLQSKDALDSSVEFSKTQSKTEKAQLSCIHTQRIPANAKNIVLGDIDNDGYNEMILGLTDRVVRSYRWIDEKSKLTDCMDKELCHLGRFVALNKWECANQIGSITLHHTSDGTPSLLIAQPGGTFMRIKCHVDEIIDNLESSEGSGSRSETITGTAIDYQRLGISRMRNQNISTEILGDFKTFGRLDSSSGSQKSDRFSKKCPYALATLDGTIMLVQDEVILWAIAVDHQIFALNKLDITGNGSDDIVVCSWDGQTYILDQDKNSIRFHLNEPVQAFHSGYYNLSTNDKQVSCLVYITFKNSIILYYDIPLKDLMCVPYEPDLTLLSKVFIKDGKTQEEAMKIVKDLDKKTKNQLIQYLLYNVKKT